MSIGTSAKSQFLFSASSSLGQNLQTSTFVAEIVFVIFISVFGLVLFSVFIGNMQRYLQSRIFRRLHSKQLQHDFRFYSLQWRTWGARFIQAAWSRYKKRKMERSLREAEDSLKEALTNEVERTPNLGATRFAANVSENLRHNGEFRTGFIASSSRIFGRGELVADSVTIVKKYLFGYFVVDILSIIPLPQVVVLGNIQILKSSFPVDTINLLKIITLVQFYTRVIRIYPMWKPMPRSSAILLTGSVTASSASVLLAIHVVGSSYYLLSVESVLRCWQGALKNSKWYNAALSDDVFLSCGQHKQTIVSLLNTSCLFIDADEMKDATSFDFGIFKEALSSHVVQSSTKFLLKFFYCLWWGLRNISSLGSNLQTSTNIWELLFAFFISVFGLFFFAVIIGNIQRYLQSRIVREEKMVKSKAIERSMSHRKLPYSLRASIRQHERYKWQDNLGVDEETLIRNLPEALRTDIKRRLCLALFRKVPMFEIMDEEFLDELSEFQRLNSKQIQHTFRFYSAQWRTWAACYIQAAWRRYQRKRLDRSLFEAEARLQGALATEVGSPTVSTTDMSRGFLPVPLELRQIEEPNKTSWHGNFQQL
ncbi:hypothetical protein L6164_004013 [Bauhinia variegata]|uniref:Uncharacterized protein n=1 Tax=Bauhinia variegata TaxID=167791 RepID=A0ACB9Q357_BAUVA|nr:hypothetical protein L6164_004013 [Bauhinia variegata]